MSGFLRPRVGLALGGGGARGLAHLGVLKVLEREKIPIDQYTPLQAKFTDSDRTRSCYIITSRIKNSPVIKTIRITAVGIPVDRISP